MRAPTVALLLCGLSFAADDWFYHSVDDLMKGFNEGLPEPLSSAKLLSFANGFLAIFGHEGVHHADTGPDYIDPACGLTGPMSQYNFAENFGSENCESVCNSLGQTCISADQKVLRMNLEACQCVVRRLSANELAVTLRYDPDVLPGCYATQSGYYYNPPPKRVSPHELTCQSYSPSLENPKTLLCACVR